MSTSPIVSTMMPVHLSLNHFLERAGLLFSSQEVIQGDPIKVMYTIHTGTFTNVLANWHKR